MALKDWKKQRFSGDNQEHWCNENNRGSYPINLLINKEKNWNQEGMDWFVIISMKDSDFRYAFKTKSE